MAAPAPAIRVALQVEAAGRLTFSVHNAVAPLPPSPLDSPGGVGLANLRRRLALLYPQQHTLVITATPQQHHTVLQVQLRPTGILF